MIKNKKTETKKSESEPYITSEIKLIDVKI